MNQHDLLIEAIRDVKETLREDIGDVKEHLRVLNGRTRKVETAVSVHWVLWGLTGAGVVGIAVPLVMRFL